MHRIGSALNIVCGEPRRPFGQKVTNLPRRVTCAACKVRSAAYKKSAKARAALAGLVL